MVTAGARSPARTTSVARGLVLIIAKRDQCLHIDEYL